MLTKRIKRMQYKDHVVFKSYLWLLFVTNLTIQKGNKTDIHITNETRDTDSPRKLVIVVQ